MKIYKRILELRPAWTEKIAVVMTQGNNAVSYTHLDVYKRQEKTLSYYRKTIEALISRVGKVVQQITTDDLRRY